MPDNTKPDLLKRFLAFLIDVVVMFILNLIPGLGAWLGLAYLLLRDGLDIEYMRHRSLGKHFMKLKPVTIDGGDLAILDSVKRNWTLAVATIISLLRLPAFLAWLLMLAAIAIAIYEIFLVITDEEGRRWGERIADTRLIESTDI